MLDINLNELPNCLRRIMKDTVSQAETLGLKITNIKQLAALTRPVFGSRVHLMIPKRSSNAVITQEHENAYIDIYLNPPINVLRNLLYA